MKFLLGIVGLVFLLANTVTAQGFDDLQKSPYADDIVALADLGVLQGYEDGSFRPEQVVNRAELVKIVFKSLEENADSASGGCFTDVQDEWFAPFVCRAREQGFVQGYGDGTYRPGQAVNMVEALKIALEAFDMPLRAAGEGEQWFDPYMDFAHENNFFSKYSYLPDRPARREEIALLVHRLLRIKNKEDVISSKREVRSNGCGHIPPANVPSKFNVDGVDRSAIVVIPDSYDSDKPISLVFAFHGRTNSNLMVRSYYGIEKPAAGQAIFVYPEGLRAGVASYIWSADKDFPFFDAMLKTLTDSYCINLDEVFVVGHSLGAWMTNSLACARGEVIRAVASLGGGRSGGECSGPVAVMQWHNPNDNLATFSSGVNARDQFLRQNQCSAETKSIAPFWGNCVVYQGCNEYAPVVWCPHNEDYDYRGQYYPHTWPKGVGEEMWNFFKNL